MAEKELKKIFVKIPVRLNNDGDYSIRADELIDMLNNMLECPELKAELKDVLTKILG